jgi:hypothetical protein
MIKQAVCRVEEPLKLDCPLVEALDNIRHPKENLK